MTKFNRSGLEAIFGKGLKDAMEDIETYKNRDKTNNLNIPISQIKINPFQPRRFFNKEKIVELAHSIKENGLIQPVLLIKDNKHYILVVGERRLRAFKHNKEKTIPANVMNLSLNELQNIALVENIQREDLNPIEEALAISEIINKQKITQNDLAQKIGKSRPYVANSLRLLQLPKEIQKLVINSDLSVGHAKVLMSLKSEIEMMELAKKIIYDQLTVRDAEKLILFINKKSKPRITTKNKHYEYVEDLLREKLDTRIVLSKNNISIKFNNEKDLNRILQLLKII